MHQLRRSVGAIVSAIHQTAQRAQPAVAAILDRIRASPVVHADETGWREDGANGYVWTFSTPTERYFLRRGRGKAVVDEALGESFSGVLVSDCYAAYHHYDGPKQRCWAHLLRDIHDQRTRYPKDAALARWTVAVHQLYVAAGAGHRAQDDAGIHLRHLARPRSKSSRRLPSAAHFPSTLNCYWVPSQQPAAAGQRLGSLDCTVWLPTLPCTVVAMYSTDRNCRRPPHTVRFPRMVPLSRL